ncbi:MAG: carbohydrate ABC transporter permease [Alphaproteobacteria bacterium]
MITRALSNVTLFLIVFIWVVPFVALVTTSLRSEVASKTSGFWTSFTPTELGHRFRTHEPSDEEVTVIEGNIFDRLNGDQPDFKLTGEVQSIMQVGRVPDPNDDTKTILRRELIPVGEALDLRGGIFVFAANGDFKWTFDVPTNPRPKRLDVFINQDPSFGLSAYQEVLLENERVPNSLIASFIVTIPATIIPITIAAFAAYAFAWMRFPGRDWLFVIVVSLMVVPTQLAFLPILSGFSGIASWATTLNAALTDCELNGTCKVASKSFASLWITHTAFGLPLAIYLLRNYIVGLPKELLESARIDGASHFQIFLKLIVPLSVPALASFSIFQFLWVWNDLIVALYIGSNEGANLVFPIRLQQQLGTFKDKLHLLNASAVISMVIPVIVFLAMQRYFIRGLLAGSVKGG